MGNTANSAQLELELGQRFSKCVSLTKFSLGRGFLKRDWARYKWCELYLGSAKPKELRTHLVWWLEILEEGKSALNLT
jgi:hypothetical protein